MQKEKTPQTEARTSYQTGTGFVYPTKPVTTLSSYSSLRFVCFFSMDVASVLRNYRIFDVEQNGVLRMLYVLNRI